MSLVSGFAFLIILTLLLFNLRSLSVCLNAYAHRASGDEQEHDAYHILATRLVFLVPELPKEWAPPTDRATKPPLSLRQRRVVIRSVVTWFPLVLFVVMLLVDFRIYTEGYVPKISGLFGWSAVIVRALLFGAISYISYHCSGIWKELNAVIDTMWRDVVVVRPHGPRDAPGGSIPLEST